MILPEKKRKIVKYPLQLQGKSNIIAVVREVGKRVFLPLRRLPMLLEFI